MQNPLRLIPRRYCFAWMLICGTVLYFFANIQRVAIPGSVFDLLQNELKVSAPYITAFGSSFMYIYAFCQLGIGLLVDRYGGSRVIAYGALAFCLGSLLFPLAHTLPLLYLSRTLTGLGASAFYLSLVKEIMRVFGKNFGIVLAVMILIGYAGGIIANAPFVMCVGAIGWRNTMLVTSLLSLAFYLLFLLARCGLKIPPIRPVAVSAEPFRSVLRKRHNRAIFLFTGINFGLYYVLQTVIGKKFLEDYCRFPSEQAAWILSLMGVISALSGLGFAIASRMLGNRRRVFIRTVGIVCISVFACITGLLLLEIHTVWIAGLLCLLAGTASTSSIAVPLLRETNLAKSTGVAVSLLNFICYLTVALLGNVVGLLMNLFAPERQGELLIYGAHSYLVVFAALFALSGIVSWFAFGIEEASIRDSTAPVF